ncbi:MAG: hypothetical protein KR126chlam3_00856 [Chlamydiae bacterium]|nr:hypothetical protein [Chlamydiota bacterium]
MSILHLCNTFFERELAGKAGNDLLAAFLQNPNFAQLQFLPYLYANEGEGLLVTEKPDTMPLPTYDLEETPPFQKVETWGYSLLAKNWADANGLSYFMPPWDLVKMVNSKTYSFAKSPLPGARLIYKGEPLEKKMVLKSCYKTAGSELIFSDTPEARIFCEAEWDRDLPVIAEPLVERILDFSTQWVISSGGEIAYLGATICKTSSQGAHKSNIAGDSPPSFVEEQKAVAMEVLQEMADLGYFGEVGIDAMIYNQNQLQPIVAINARKTLGWVALMVQKRKYPKEIIELSYLPSEKTGPLPNQLGPLKFSRQITIQILDRLG